MTTDQPETLVDTFVRFGRIEDGFGCRVGVGLAPCWACILRDDDCERQYIELAVWSDAREAHGQPFAMTFDRRTPSGSASSPSGVPALSRCAASRGSGGYEVWRMTASRAMTWSAAIAHLRQRSGRGRNRRRTGPTAMAIVPLPLPRTPQPERCFITSSTGAPVVGSDTAGRKIQLSVDDWVLGKLMTFDAEVADGGDDEPAASTSVAGLTDQVAGARAAPRAGACPPEGPDLRPERAAHVPGPHATARPGLPILCHPRGDRGWL
jgi:hypothetical protein